jgi:capsular exopolysaccharide synthesis family protein
MLKPSKGRSGHGRDLFADLDMDAPHVTEVRRLLQALSRADREGQRRVYLITSSARGDGKSTLSALLGIIAARIFRKRTLIIDADLRRPTMHRLMGIAQSPGLFEAMHGGLSSVAVPLAATPLPSLRVIPSGIARAPAVDAYDDRRFRELLDGWRSQFDLILVDAPPVVPVVEPLMIAEHVDAILVVAFAGRTPVTLFRRTKQVLEPVAGKIVGIVLNNAADSLPYYYEHRYYGYRTTETTRRADPPAHLAAARQIDASSPADLRQRGADGH